MEESVLQHSSEGGAYITKTGSKYRTGVHRLRQPQALAGIVKMRLSTKSHRLHSWLIAMAVALSFTLACPVTAYSWANGPGGDGFGTHDWVLYEANHQATSAGVTWLDWSVAQKATDDPDTVLHDTYYHVYDIWGSTYGNSPQRVAQLYAETVQALKAGDTAGASRSFGLLSHYYSDTCNPLHTDQSTAEDSIHSRYEDAVDNVTTMPGQNRSWVGFDGIQYLSDASQATKLAASQAHTMYTDLVTEYSNNGFDPKVSAITASSLNNAVNGLVDLMASAQKDAAYSTVPPTTGSAPSLASSPTQEAQTSSNPQKISPSQPALQETDTASQVGAEKATAASASVAAGTSQSRDTWRTLLLWGMAGGVFLAALFGAMKGRRG
ncbi:MAG: hypothetical protein HGA39_06410 [Coriobacteriia bacterium]|nr:hypothetical protein [Coriobacteriia bacterium]